MLVDAKSVERIWSQIDKNGPASSLVGGLCWIWNGSKENHGYGRTQVKINGKWKGVLIHRLIYELVVGPIPRPLPPAKYSYSTLDHLCRNRSCVNPKHLEPVSNRENILRGVSPSAIHAKKTHCPQGHEYSPKNTKICGIRRFRVCKTCLNAGRTRKRATAALDRMGRA